MKARERGGEKERKRERGQAKLSFVSYGPDLTIYVLLVKDNSSLLLVLRKKGELEGLLLRTSSDEISTTCCVNKPQHQTGGGGGGGVIKTSAPHAHTIEHREHAIRLFVGFRGCWYVSKQE